MMSYSKLFFAILVLSHALLYVGCAHEDNATFPDETKTFIQIAASDTTIGVGLDKAVRISAQVTQDATGDIAAFSTPSGSFLLEEAKTTVEKVVDINGKASVDWFAPEEPGTVLVTVSIKTVTQSISIRVTPVPEIAISGLPDSIVSSESVLFRVKVPSEWKRKPIEIRAPDAVLKATGPVDQDLDMGSRILPVTDESGEVAVIFMAPNMPMQIIVTASLFGTRQSKQVVIK